MRSLVLLSGGIESAVLLRLLLNQGRQPLPLVFNYAQRGAVFETRAAELACSELGLHPPECLDLTGVGEAFRREQR